MITKTIFDLTALEIGISSKKWDYMYERDPEFAKREFMTTQQYDILPLKNSNGKFENFMVTDEWNNYDKIKSRHKSTLPKLTSDSDFQTILSEFVKNKEKYFLLHKGATIVGLISVANFGYREIYKRLYILLADLEIKLANWLFSLVNEEEAFDLLLKRSHSNNNKAVLGQFLLDKRNGTESHLMEYLYLSSLHSIIKEKAFYEKIGFNKREWDEIANPIFETRNSVAHPIRSIIREKKDFERVVTTLKSAKLILYNLKDKV